MIDFLKMMYLHQNIVDFLKRLHGVRSTVVFDEENGAIEFPYEYELGQYSIIIKLSEMKNAHIIEIKGSPHKNFYGDQNYSRFTIYQFQSEMQMLCKLLNLEPDKLIIQNLELGVNIRTAFRPIKFLDDNLLMYKTKKFKAYPKGKCGKEIGYFCEGSTHVKAYDKGLQSNLDYHLFRFEMKFKKSGPFKKYGISTLSDLMNPALLRNFAFKLIHVWDDVLLYESDLKIESSTLKSYDMAFYKECAHYKNWKEWLRGFMSRDTFYFRKKRFKAILEAHGKNVHKILRQDLICEIEMCFSSQELVNWLTVQNDTYGKL